MLASSSYCPGYQLVVSDHFPLVFSGEKSKRVFSSSQRHRHFVRAYRRFVASGTEFEYLIQLFLLGNTPNHFLFFLFFSTLFFLGSFSLFPFPFCYRRHSKRVLGFESSSSFKIQEIPPSSVASEPLARHFFLVNLLFCLHYTTNMAGSEAGNLDAYLFFISNGRGLFSSTVTNGLRHSLLFFFFSPYSCFSGTIGLKIRGKLQQCTTIGSARNLHRI